MISQLRMMTEKPYYDGAHDATEEILQILKTALSFEKDEDVVNALTAFVVGTETALNTGSADKATQAYLNVREMGS